MISHFQKVHTIKTLFQKQSNISLIKHTWKNTYVCKPSNFDHNYDTIHIHTVSRSMFLRITFCTRNFIKNCCAKDKLCLVFWELFSRPQCLYFGINSSRSKNIIQLWKLLENAGKNKKSSVRHQKLKAGSKQTGFTISTFTSVNVCFYAY